jgi:hypothetical protein
MSLHSHFDDSNRLLFQLRLTTYLDDEEFRHELTSCFPVLFLKNINQKIWEILNIRCNCIIDSEEEAELINLMIDSIIKTPISKFFYYDYWITQQYSQSEILNRLLYVESAINVTSGDYFSSENNQFEFFHLRNEWFYSFFYNRHRFDEKVKEKTICELHNEIYNLPEKLKDVFLDNYKKDNLYFSLINNAGVRIVVITKNFNLSPILIFCP